MKWASPWAFGLFAPLILFMVWYFFRNRKNRATMAFSSVQLFARIQKGVRTRLLFLPSLLKFLALVLAIVALARPQTSDKKVNKNVEGVDIMLVLDISDSMDIEDMQPSNRITAAKQVIKNFIKGRTNDRLGLIVFSGEAYTRCPLTLDYPVLLESLDGVETEGLKMGTAIGVALANGVARLKDSTAKSRVLVLLTDGESNSGTVDPYTALDIAKGYGIKVYTIGVGVNGQAQLPVYSKDAFGRKVKHYQPIHSTVNDELLTKLAEDTGGKYYRATDTEALKKVFKDIDRLEKTKVHVNEYVRFNEVFEKYLVWAMVFYCLQMVLSLTVLRRAP